MSFVPLACSAVRDRLAELALGVLPPEEAERIERHLESCPGCRKERAALEEGAATLGFSLAPADPPASLEHRVLDRLAQASGRRVPAQAHHRLRTQVRRMASVALIAAILASVSVGWAFTERQRASEVARQSRRVAASGAVNLAELIKSLGPTPVQATLAPTVGRRGTGSAAIVSTDRQNLILVIVYLAHATNGPYTVRLETKSGLVFNAGQMQRTTNGTLIYYDSPGHDLSKVEFVSVLDNRARPVMTGRVRPFAPSPSP
jgi:hypothetical protein